MKKILFLVMFLGLSCGSASLFAQTTFSATLIKEGTYLSIRITDQSPIPPYLAGEFWQVIKGNDPIKVVNENELKIVCNAYPERTGDMFGDCSLLMPVAQFTKIKKLWVFKATGSVATRLNRYFKDSAYYSIQGNQVYLSAYNTRNLFFFGINEDLIEL